MNATSRCDRLLCVPEQFPARQALEAVFARLVDHSETPDHDARLIVLHGPSGSGKTHLVHWLIDEIAAAATVQVVAAESLKAERSTREGMGGNDNPAEPDLLVVEDLQFLAPAAVETFIERVDLRSAEGLITIVTASAGPRHLCFRGEPLSARLTSRLAAGLVIATPLPQAESRRQALDAFLAEAELSVPESVVDFLVATSKSFRSLEGAVNQLTLLSRLEPGPLKAAPLLEHFRTQSESATLSVDKIVQRVAGRFQVSAKDVRSRSRRRGIVTPRHVSMYLTRRLTALSFQQIGAYFGGCDHATVMHACRKMEQTLEHDPQLGGAIRQLHDDLS